MAWLLDTPYTYNPGHGKTAVNCTHIKACGKFTVHLDDLTCRFAICYGTKVGGSFVSVEGTEENFFIKDTAEHQDYTETGEIGTVPANPAFTILSSMALSAAASELAWDTVAKAIYGYITTLSTVYAGTHD